MRRRDLMLLMPCAAIVLSLTWSGIAPAGETDEDRSLTAAAGSDRTFMCRNDASTEQRSPRSTGGDGAHNVMQPFTVTRFIIIT